MIDDRLAIVRIISCARSGPMPELAKILLNLLNSARQQPIAGREARLGRMREPSAKAIKKQEQPMQIVLEGASKGRPSGALEAQIYALGEPVASSIRRTFVVERRSILWRNR